MCDESKGEMKIGVKRMIEVAPQFWGRNKDWNEGLMKAEIKQQIVEREQKHIYEPRRKRAVNQRVRK